MKKAILALLPLCALASVAAHGQTIAGDNFEGDTGGSIAGQGGWTIPTGFGGSTDFTVENTVSFGGSQALEIADDTTYSGSSANKIRARDALGTSISPTYLSGQGTNNFWIDAEINPMPTNESNNAFFFQLITAGGFTANIQLRTNDTVSNGAGALYTPGAWNRLTLNVFEVADGANFDLYANVYLNGVELNFSGVSGDTFEGGNTEDLILTSGATVLQNVSANSITLTTLGIESTVATGVSGAGAYLDNLSVTLNNPLAVPEPRLELLFALGAAAFTFRCFRRHLCR